MKETFRRNKLALAMAAALGGAALLSSPVQAVNLAEDGLGDLLIFPYYTSRGGWDTQLNITNTSSVAAVAFKIRMREALNSRDVLDFIVILSPNDVWTATITAAPTGGARLVTRDKSCTVPELPLLNAEGLRGQNFFNAGYTGVSADTGPTGIDRTTEGYIEVIQMGHTFGTYLYESVLTTTPPSLGAVIAPTDAAAVIPSTATNIFALTKHNNVGDNQARPTCGSALRAALNPASPAPGNLYNPPLNIDVLRQFGEPINVLKGNYSLVNAAGGVAAAGTAVTLANFFNLTTVDGPGGPASATVPGSTPVPGATPPGGPANQLLAGRASLLFAAGGLLPNLDQVYPPVGFIRPDTPGQGVSGLQIGAGFTRPMDAVSFVLTRSAAVNQWSVNPGFGARTAWVVTFPTKKFYTDQAVNANDPNASLAPFINGQNTGYGAAVGEQLTAGIPPFANLVRADSDAGKVFGACNEVGFKLWDREEFTDTTPAGFSPPTAGTSTSLCYETNVISFGQFNLLSSKPANAQGTGGPLVNVSSANLPANTGWLRLVLDQDPAASSSTVSPLRGLPTVGFAITRRAVGAIDSNFATLWDHAYERSLGSQGGITSP
ncbi:MAG: hypothetical protein R6X17_06455 [Candidatus Competibacteraceae bacterium]